MRRLALLAWIALLPAGAHAEGGELYVEPRGGFELGRLRYARDGLSSAGGSATSGIALGPSAGLWLRYGISDDWQLGIGAIDRATGSIH